MRNKRANFGPVVIITSTGWRYLVHPPIQGEVRQILNQRDIRDGLPRQDDGRELEECAKCSGRAPQQS